MMHKRVKFDDWCIYNEGRWIWSQICNSSLAKHKQLESSDPQPLIRILCGVEGCNNEADYYIELVYEYET